MRFTRALALLCTALLLLAPAASASHWFLYHAGIETSVGATREPDEAVVDDPSHPLFGVTNKVVHGGQTPGDGSLFLDAVIGTRGVWLTPVTFYHQHLSEELLGRPDILLPGYNDISAWYGWWNDGDEDNFIDDVHDSACAGSACPEDEFIWKGKSSGHPETQIGIYTTYSPRSAYDYLLQHRYLVDQTNADSEQGWVGQWHLNADQGLITSAFLVTVADAQPLLGHALGHDLDDPNALIDVDRYNAISSDVELLYLSSYRALAGGGEGLIRFAVEVAVMGIGVAGEVAREVMPLIFESLEPVWETGAVETAMTLAQPALDLATEVAQEPREANRAVARTMLPPYAREPNTWEDDSEQRAYFGGVGDYHGSGNSYPGYFNEPGLYFDNRHEYGACMSASGSIGATHITNIPMCWTNTTDPLGGIFLGERTSGAFLQFESYVFMWRDANGDGHVGKVCDPSNPDEFDAERNACHNPPWPWPHDFSSEVWYICQEASLRSTTFTVQPVGGPWPGVYVVRDYYKTLTLGVSAAQAEYYDGYEEITLTWQPYCGSERAVRSADGILFPGGPSDVVIRVEAEASIPGYYHGPTGIQYGPQKVVDVDYIPAWM